MNRLLSRVITITMGLCLIYTNSQAMIVAASCLKRMGPTKMGRPTKNKLLILHDKHAFDPDDLVKRGHIDDMRKLISSLENSKETVPFLVEISELHKSPERLNNMIESPSNVAIKLALENKMRYGSINFIPFDDRKHYDIWMRDMLWQTDQFTQAIRQNYQFPSDFYNITTENFLAHLDSRYNSTLESIDNLPVSQIIKKQNYDTNKQKYKDSCILLNQLLKSYKVNSEQHLFNLIAQLNDSERTQLFLTLNEEYNFALDINLLNNVLQQSEDHPLSILLAGAYHSNIIEKRLLSQFPDFEKDLSSSMSLQDLKVDNLSHIEWPKQVPDNFMNENMKRFLATE
jgi:hypothetical protein